MGYDSEGIIVNDKDLNYIVKVEKAIAKKYGEETIQNPRANWDDEKEQDYLEQIKILYKKETRQRDKDEKVQKEGFLVSKKLLNKREDRTCPACFQYSFKPIDDVYMNKYDCCHRCYLGFVKDNEERWLNLNERVDLLVFYYTQGENDGNRIRNC